MLLTVIIPCYNNSYALGRCLESLASALSGGKVEAVVVDDGSSPDEAERIERLSCRCGTAVQCVRIPHSGASAARNSGMLLARGRYVWFVDSDDTLIQPTLPYLLSQLDSLPADTLFFHTGSMTQREDNDAENDFLPPDMGATRKTDASRLLVPRTACLDHTTYIISSSLLKDEALRYPEGRRLLEDSSFVLRMLEKAACGYENPTMKVYLRHSGTSSITASAWSAERSEAFVNDICLFFDEFGTYVGRHGDYTRLQGLYARYRYVYLRVLAVKGAPWSCIARFRTQVLGEGAKPSSFAEAVLFVAPIHRFLAWICRTIRRNY